MRYIGLFLFLFLNVILQTTLLTYFEIGGVKPNLVLILVCFFAILNGSRAGGIFGFLAGLFLDLASGRYLGLNALAFAAVGAVLGMLEYRLYKDNLLVPMGSVFGGTILFHVVAFGLALFAGLRLSFNMVVDLLVLQTLYNTAAASLLYGYFLRISNEGWLRKKEVVGS
ncbi:MAG: rod shape-determining protein MreD [Heliobacteriaceae bacterium]|nr:rod shape-determining protein MreD [Heliobacteriaceae bacterium]MDD4586919.1 rod shape-determining protein MreD [Heliobacteriaceae bacterium]